MIDKVSAHSKRAEARSHIGFTMHRCELLSIRGGNENRDQLTSTGVALVAVSFPPDGLRDCETHGLVQVPVGVPMVVLVVGCKITVLDLCRVLPPTGSLA